MNICCYNNRPERRNPRIKYVYLPGPAGPAGSTGATGATGSTQASETLATNFSAQPSAQSGALSFYDNLPARGSVSRNASKPDEFVLNNKGVYQIDYQATVNPCSTDECKTNSPQNHGLYASANGNATACSQWNMASSDDVYATKTFVFHNKTPGTIIRLNSKNRGAKISEPYFRIGYLGDV